MTPDIPSTPNTEALSPGYHRRAVYAPFVWLAVMVMRLGLRAGIISPEFLMPARPHIAPLVMHRNRQLRRARVACLRRAHRALRKHGKINKEKYTPKAYAYYAYISRMDKTITPAQFNEHYLRDNNISRVEIYRMDSAQEITGFVPELSAAMSGMLTSLAALMHQSMLSLAAPADPAPP